MWTLPVAIFRSVVAAATQWFLDNFDGAAPTLTFDDTFTGGAFLRDTFTGALGLLTSHTSDSGHTWAYSTNIDFGSFSPHTGDVKINGGGLVGMDTANGYGGVVSNATPPSADYYVEVGVNGSFTDSQVCGIAARYDETTGHGYFLTTFPVDATHVAVIVESWGASGSGTIIGRGSDHVVADSTNYVARLSVSGTTISASLNGTVVGSVTDTRVSAAGSVGFWLSPRGTGTYDEIAFDYIIASVADNNLAVHTTDSGHTWSAYPGSTVADLSLSGGNLILASGGTDKALSSYTHPDSIEVTATFVVTNGGTTGGGTTLRILCFDDLSGTVHHQYYAQVTVDVAGNMDWEGGSFGGVTDGGAPSGTITGVADGSHTLSINARLGAQSISIDGVQVATTTAALTSAGRHLSLELDNSGDAVQVAVDRISLLDLTSGTLATHAPDVGGAYVGPATDLALDGAGNLTLDAGSYVTSSASPADPTAYSVEAKVTLGTPTSGAFFDWGAYYTSGSSFLVNPYVHVDPTGGAHWVLQTLVSDSSASTLYTDDVDLTPFVGSAITLRAEVTPSGTTFKVNGSTVATTSSVPDVGPDAMIVGTNNGSGSTAAIDYINGSADGGGGPIDPTAMPLDDTFSTDALLSAHTADTGQSWTITPAAVAIWAGDTDLAISGGYVQRIAGADGELYSSLVMPDSYVIIIDFEVVKANGISAFGVFAQWDGATSSYLEFEYTQGVGSQDNFSITLYGGSGAAIVYSGTGEAVDGSHTLRIEVSPGATLVKYDGAVKETWASPIRTGNVLDFFMSANTDPSSTKITRLRVLAHTVAVFDSFTGTDGTSVLGAPHTGEVGATWTRVAGIGADSDGEFVIHSDAIRRPTFAEDSSSDGGEAMMYASGALPGGTTAFTIEFGFTFDEATAGGGGQYIALYEKCDTSPAFICQAGINVLGVASGSIGLSYDGGTTAASGAFTNNHEYTATLTVNGTSLVFTVTDGATVIATTSWTRGAMPVGKFGIDMYDSLSVAAATMTYFKVSA